MPQPPPRDVSGQVTPHDHDEILNEDGVLRRISDKQVVSRADGRRTLSSMAFKHSGGPNGGMSIDLESWIEGAGLDARQFVTTPRWAGSVRLVAGDLREANCQVGWDPLERTSEFPDNPYHGEVWGIADKEKQREVHQLAEWYVPMEGVDIR